MPRKAKSSLSAMKRFVLIRAEDVSGTSGTGVVAEGVQYTNGRVSMRLLTQFQSDALFDNIATVEAIHGHDGRTTIKWID